MIEQRESLDPEEVIDSFMNQKDRSLFLNDAGDSLVDLEKSREYCNAEYLIGLPRSNGNSDISMPSGFETSVVASEQPDADRVEGQSVGHQEAGAQESFAGQNTSFLEGNSMEIMPVVPANSREKKVGTLLAAAMRKYAVPRSSCYHGVTK